MVRDRQAEIDDLSAQIAELQHQRSLLSEQGEQDEQDERDIAESQIAYQRLHQLAGLSTFHVQARRGALIHDLRDLNVRWAEIADALGMTQQGAQKIHKAYQRLSKRRGRR